MSHANLPTPRVTDKLRIVWKIGIAFAAILCCDIALGLFSIDRLRGVEGAAEIVSAYWLPTTRTLGDIAFLAQRFRVIEAAFLLAPAPGKAAEEKTLLAIRGQIDQAFQAQAELARTDEERRWTAASAALWRDYLGLDTTFIEAAKSAGDAAAGALYRSEMRDSIHLFQDALAKGVNANIRGADDATEAGAEIGRFAERAIYAGIGVAALVCVALGLGLDRKVALPIGALTKAMTALADGQAEAEIPGLHRGDEIGAMARASAFFKQRSLERRRQLEREAETQRAATTAAENRALAEREQVAVAQAAAMTRLGLALKRLAEGDLTLRLNDGFTAEYADIRDDFNSAIDRLRATLLSVVQSSASIESWTGRVAESAGDLSARTAQQAESLAETVAAIGQIVSAATKAAAGAQGARGVVGDANRNAASGAAIMNEALEAMNGIARSSQEINQILGAIDEIALQTNLLALNAGVEAARAGEAGRGFAVVAAEVRALALRSGEAASQIKRLVASSGAQMRSGVARVGDAGQSLNVITGEVARIDAIVEDIAAGAKLQTRSLDEVSTAMRRIDDVTHQNAETAQQTAEATRRLSQEAATLARLVGQFRVEAARGVARAAG